MAGNQEKFQLALTHAKRFSEQGNWTEAIKAYRFALAEFPNDELAITGFGRATFLAGQIDLSQRAFQQALKLNPSNVQALNFMADIQERLRKTDAAAETYLRIGNIMAADNDLDAAIEAWLRTIALLPDHIDAHEKLAQTLVHQERPREAARQLLALAAIYQRRNDDERAMQQIENAGELIENDPGVLAAMEALQQGMPILPDEISDTRPEIQEEAGDAFDFTDFPDAFSEAESFDQEEEDPFALDEFEPRIAVVGGLIGATQQDALAELANVIFEEDNTPVGFEGTLSGHEMSMLIVQAIDLQSRGEINDAINNYQRVLKAGTERPALYFNLGILYKNQGKYDEAAEMLAVSAQDNKYDSGSHLALGDTYYAANNLDIAIKHYVEAVKLIDLKTVNSHRAQQLVQYYASLADKYIANGDNDKIMSFIRTVGSFFAKSSWQEKVIEARQRMDSVAEDGNVMSLAEFLEAPETEVVVTTLAVTKEYIRRNLLMTASEECLRAIQKAPSFLRLHLLLAEILLRQDQTDQAITKYLYIAKVYQMRKQPDKAVEVFEKILRLAPMDVTVRSKLIDLHTSLEHFEQALDQYLVLADAYYQLAQVDRALEKYNEALRLTSTIGDPDTWKAKILSQMGDIYNQRFDWARATTAYEELISVNPHDEHTQRQLVDLYFKQGKTDQAIVALDKLLTTYQQQDASSKPVELLKELVSGHPENMPLRERLAVAYAQSGMKREAIAEYDALGEMQLESGLRDQATQTIQKILTLGPDDAEGYRRLLSKISGGVT